VALAQGPRRVRAVGGTAPKMRATALDEDALRARRASANRIMTTLRAALNFAFREGRVASDLAWRRVKPFAKTDVARVRYLTGDEAQRLVNACAADFRNLVRAALMTGGRYGELVALRVSDIDLDAGTALFRVTKNGKPRHSFLTTEGVQVFAALVAGRAPDEHVLLRADGNPWGKSQQRRPMEQACEHAKIGSAASFHTLRHTYGAMLAMRGVPLAVVSKALGHADTRITERHYHHLAPSYLAETIRAGLPTLGIVGDETLVPLKAMRP
jgi:integrase